MGTIQQQSSESRKAMMNEAESVLLRKRGVNTGWHAGQSVSLLKFALETKSQNALVYAALEARNALERFAFEMSVLASGGKLTQEQEKLANQKDGPFILLEQTMPNYRRHIEFTNLLLAEMKDLVAEKFGKPMQMMIPDLKTVRRHRTALSKYCHIQLRPEKTVDHPDQAWFKAGIHCVRETLKMIRDFSDNPIGLITAASMEPEEKKLFDQFLRGEIDAAAASLQVKIMRPVLEKRWKIREAFERK